MVVQLDWDLEVTERCANELMVWVLVVIERVRWVGFTECVYCIVEEGDGVQSFTPLRLGRMRGGGG